MQTSTNQVKAGYSFTVETNNNIHTIHYQRAKYGAGIVSSILVPSALLSFLLVMMANSGFSGWLTMTLVLSLGTFFALNYLRPDGSFSISETAIIIKGKEYDKAHISRLFIKAPDGYEETMPVTRSGHGFFVVGGDRPSAIGLGAATAVTGAVGGLARAGGLAMQGSRNNIRKHYQAINYAVGFCYGEQNVKLATGLKENTAHVLLDKVIELSRPAA